VPDAFGEPQHGFQYSLVWQHEPLDSSNAHSGNVPTGVTIESDKESRLRFASKRMLLEAIERSSQVVVLPQYRTKFDEDAAFDVRHTLRSVPFGHFSQASRSML